MLCAGLCESKMIFPKYTEMEMGWEKVSDFQVSIFQSLLSLITSCVKEQIQKSGRNQALLGPNVMKVHSSR